MQALTAVIERSKETTMMGIERELKDAAASLERCAHLSLTCLQDRGFAVLMYQFSVWTFPK